MNRLLILDASAMLNRYYFAGKSNNEIMGIPDKNGKIHPVKALESFFSKIQYLQNYGYEYIAVCLDHSKELLNRKKIYPEYKSNRPPKDEALSFQLGYLEKICKKFNLPLFVSDGIEADDFAGSIATQLQNSFDGVDIITIDRDYFQLIDQKTNILLMVPSELDAEGHPITPADAPIGLKRITADKLKIQYGLTPSQIVDWKSLSGDTSDNIPGIKGVGDKAAIPLLQHYQTLNNILIAAKTTDPNVLKEEWKTLGIKRANPLTFITGESNAIMSYQLATIIKHLPVPQAKEQYRFQITKEQYQWLNEVFGMELYTNTHEYTPQPSIVSQPSEPDIPEPTQITEEEEIEMPF